MGKHLSKIERQKIILTKQKQELLIQEAYRKSARIKQNFVALINDAQNRQLRNEYANHALFQLLVSFLIQNEALVRQKTLAKWMGNLAFIAQQIQDKCPKWFKEPEYVRALIEVAKYRSWWVRPLEVWRPKSKGDYERFKEMVAYLFAQYRYPAFMNHLFFYQQDHFFVQDFIYLAQGGSLKNMHSIIRLTQKMKVEFMKSPEGLRIYEAFRHAQVIGLGGDELLAHRLAYSWLGRKEDRNEIFWEDFIRILIAGGMFNHDKISELIDYTRYELNQNPAYSLKGRTLQSLMRQSDQWHQAVSYEQRKTGIVSWKSGNFESFEQTEGKAESTITYKIVELLSNKELTEEGQKMHHCVGSYTYHCEKGYTRIVSLRRYFADFDEERLATIEVDMRNKRIVQAKYRYNKPISEKALSFLHHWANLNGFVMGKYL